MEEENEEENQEQISLMEEENEEENQKQISLMEEENEEENQEQISLELLKNSQNLGEIKCELSDLETSTSNEIITKKQETNKIKQYTNTQKLPLPYIKNLRKWINKDKKAS